VQTTNDQLLSFVAKHKESVIPATVAVEMERVVRVSLEAQRFFFDDCTALKKDVGN